MQEWTILEKEDLELFAYLFCRWEFVFFCFCLFVFFFFFFLFFFYFLELISWNIFDYLRVKEK